jgi:hypothetical protein
MADIILEQGEQLDNSVQTRFRDLGNSIFAEVFYLQVAESMGNDIVVRQDEQIANSTQIRFVDMGDGTHAKEIAITEDNLRELFDTISAFAEIYVADGAVPQAGIGAGAVVVTGFDTNGLSQNMTADVANNRIICRQAGVYDVDFDISFTGSANTVFEMHIYVNGVEQHQGLHRAMSGGDVGSASLGGKLNLGRGDIVDVRVNVAAGPGNTIVPVDAQLSLTRIGSG